MSKENLNKLCKLFGFLGLLSFIGSFFIELNVFHFRNDDELFIFGLVGTIIFLLIFCISLLRKMYLYENSLGLKIIFILSILIIITSFFFLLLFSTFNLNMI